MHLPATLTGHPGIGTTRAMSLRSSFVTAFVAKTHTP